MTARPRKRLRLSPIAGIGSATHTNEVFSIYFRPQERVYPAILMGVIVQLLRDKPAPTLD